MKNIILSLLLATCFAGSSFGQDVNAIKRQRVAIDALRERIAQIPETVTDTPFQSVQTLLSARLREISRIMGGVPLYVAEARIQGQRDAAEIIRKAMAPRAQTRPRSIFSRDLDKWAVLSESKPKSKPAPLKLGGERYRGKPKKEAEKVKTETPQ